MPTPMPPSTTNSSSPSSCGWPPVAYTTKRPIEARSDAPKAAAATRSVRDMRVSGMAALPADDPHAHRDQPDEPDEQRDEALRHGSEATERQPAAVVGLLEVP